MPASVFLSYVREDEALVDLLARDLQSRGVNVWLDRAQISPGARWKDAIRHAIRHGGVYLPCFSKRYALREKTYMKEELQLAIGELQRRPASQGWFIPVLFDGEVPEIPIAEGQTLRDLQWVDLSRGWAAGVDSIARSIGAVARRVQGLHNEANFRHAKTARTQRLEQRKLLAPLVSILNAFTGEKRPSSVDHAISPLYWMTFASLQNGLLTARLAAAEATLSTYSAKADECKRVASSTRRSLDDASLRVIVGDVERALENVIATTTAMAQRLRDLTSKPRPLFGLVSHPELDLAERDLDAAVALLNQYTTRSHE
jgi:hypothetical protein